MSRTSSAPSKTGNPSEIVTSCDKMAIEVNGEAVQLDAGLTVTEWLAQLGKEPHLVAVELNREILPRDQYSTTTLSAGDQVELVQFVQGG